MHNDVLLALVVITAVSFDITNGFHDTANAMATSIATRALPPKIAVALSAVLNVVGAFLSLKVAATIASGIVDSHVVTLPVVFAGLMGAIVWNLATWLLGLPSSSSHALIGGIVGAVLVAAGRSGVHFDVIVSHVIVPALASPLIAALVATLGTFFAYRISSRADEKSRTLGFRLGQIGTASLVSLAHGTNDAQKTMGVITLALVTNGTIGASAGTPDWVVLTCALAIGLGTWTGGWRVIRTLGKGLVEIESPQGFAAEASSAAVLLAGSHFGYPISTTQVCSGSILGSGLGKRLAEVHWVVMGRMAVAWLLTLPAAGLVAAAVGKVQGWIGGSAGVVVMALCGVAFAAGIYVLSRRNPVNAKNVNESARATAPAAPTPVRV